MSKRIEIEQKFFCNDKVNLLRLIEENKFSLISKSKETDEYFTDIDSTYIKNRTCLRVRTSNENEVELTFKGKSHEFNNLYAKEESNIKIDINERADIIKMLHSLGYYSYSVVDKIRNTFSKQESSLHFNIMIDEIINIGLFVEFEILCTNSDEDVALLKNKLDMFVSKFSELNLKSADIPYRDFVARKIYENIAPDDKVQALLLDLDGTLINSEKIFFDSFKKSIRDKYNYKITPEEYETNELNTDSNLIDYLKLMKIIPKKDKKNKIMEHVYLNYEEEFIKLISKDDAILNFELLRKIKEKNLKLALVTTSKRKFVEILINTLSIDNLFDYIVCREDVGNLKPDKEAYSIAINALGIAKKNILAVEDSGRGLESAKNAGVKVIHISKEPVGDFVNIDTFSRLAFILINH